MNSYLGPNCIVYPLDYASIKGGLQRGLQILINLGQQDVKLQQGIVLGHYQKAPSEDIMITQEDIFGVNIGEPWAPGEVEEVLRGNEKGFITSPADIDPREPIKLRDAEITPEHKKAFQDLCSEFEVIFSRDSADLGKTPLLKMDIPTGDNPPITQRPYTLALKHVQWVQEEIEVLEKAGVIAKSVSPWASPIVIVPKKTAPGEPPRRRMCVDYRMLNQLLPKVDKAHSKAKGVLTLVPLPKIDEIYAKLEGSTIYSTFDMRSGYYHLELNVIKTEVKLISLAPVTPVSKSGKPMDPIPDRDILQWGISPEEIIQRQKADKFCQSIRDRIKKAGSRVVHPYYLEEELLMRYVEDNKQRFEVIVIPQDLSNVVLKLAHDDLGHNGSARTYMVVRRNYYWKGLRPDVVRYVKRCTICRKYNSASPKYNKGTFQAPEAPMDFISMDLIGEFHPPSTHGNKYALTVICMLSGWTWCIPIPDKTAPVVIQAYLKHVHHVFGPSRKILSDNGTEFSNKLFENVAKELGVEHKIYSPPYRPQSNGRIEGFHAFLKTCLAKHVSPSVEWDEVCTLATAAYNFLPNEHSRESPFFIMFGHDPRLPLTKLLQHKLRYLGTDETILSLQALRNMYLIIAENLRKARDRNDTAYPKKSTTIQQNQLVTLKVHIRKTLDPRYEGTYRVIRIKGNQVELARNGTVTPTKWAHISHVKPLL